MDIGRGTGKREDEKEKYTTLLVLAYYVTYQEKSLLLSQCQERQTPL